jgi:hypothetical protein
LLKKKSIKKIENLKDKVKMVKENQEKIDLKENQEKIRIIKKVIKMKLKNQIKPLEKENKELKELPKYDQLFKEMI